MEYIIAGIRIDVPHGFTTGAFGMALAPFAAENKRNGRRQQPYGGPRARNGDNRSTLPVGNPGDGKECTPPCDIPGGHGTTRPHPAHGTARRRHGRLLRTRRIRLHRRRCRLPFRPRHGGLPAYHDTARRQRPARFHKAFGSPDATSDITRSTIRRCSASAVDDVQHRRAGRAAVAVHSSVISLDGAPYSSSANRARERAPTRACGASISPGTPAQRRQPDHPDRPGRGCRSGKRSRADTIPALQGVLACGSPWSGKTPCYRNVSHPIAGIVRLSQAPQNRIRRLRSIEAIGRCCLRARRRSHTTSGWKTPSAASYPKSWRKSRLPPRMPARCRGSRLSCRTVFGDDAQTPPLMLLTNRLFFEQVEAMLAEGHEVQIRMKGHSMRPLLRNERDIAVLTPIAKYAPAPVPAAGAPADPVPETRAADGNASTARQTRLSGDTPGTAPDLHTPACGTRHPAPPPSGIGALRTGDVVLFRCEGRHILHRIVGIETGVRCEGNRPVCAPAAGNAPSPAASAENPAERDSAAGTLRFTLSGDGNYRTTEHCLGKDIVAVMTAVILPSGRIVRTSSRRWKRRSRRWLALPRGVRRFVLRVMWRLGIR